MNGWIYFIELLPSNNRRDTHTNTDMWEVFMKHAVELGLGDMIYSISSFIKIGSSIRKLIGPRGPRHTDTQAYRQHGDSISLLSFF
jgi:hypothetical protein